MYAMQYTIQLPANYDMEIIRNRVRNNGHIFDGFAGLEFKAFLILDKSQGANYNAYAPFYIWKNTEGMRSFCLEKIGYNAIVRDFGRHPIQDWMVADFSKSNLDYSKAKSLSISKINMIDGTEPSSYVSSVIEPFIKNTSKNTIIRAAAIDITQWSMILIEMSTEYLNQNNDYTTVFEVLHISEGMR